MRRIALVVALALVLAFSAVSYADPGVIKIIVNGQEIHPDVPPQIIDGRTMVPVRFVAEALGCAVEWDENNDTVLITNNNYSDENLIRPPIVIGDKEFTDKTQKALALLHQKAPGAYWFVCQNVKEIILTKEEREDASAWADSPNGICYFKTNIGYIPDDESIYRATIIVHEAVHIQLHRSSLDMVLSNYKFKNNGELDITKTPFDDNEAIAYLASCRVAKQLGGSNYFINGNKDRIYEHLKF